MSVGGWETASLLVGTARRGIAVLGVALLRGAVPGVLEHLFVKSIQYEAQKLVRVVLRAWAAHSSWAERRAIQHLRAGRGLWSTAQDICRAAQDIAVCSEPRV